MKTLVRATLCGGMSFVLLGVFSLSCTTTSSSFLKSDGMDDLYSKREPATVEAHKKLPAKTKFYTEIGAVYAEKDTTNNFYWSLLLAGMPMAFYFVYDDDVIPLLKEEAKKNGADAIININYVTGTIWSSKLTATAIVFPGIKRLSEQKSKSLTQFYSKCHLKEFGCYKEELVEIKKIFFKRYPQWSKKDKEDILVGTVRMGFTKEQFLLAREEPDDINKTVGSWGVHEQWVYKGRNDKYFYFENGTLKSWQR